MPSGLHRTYGAHHLHFITCSCYRRLPFLNSGRSRDKFLSILEQTRIRYRFIVVGYVVMPEHIHLLFSEPEVGTPSTVMQVLKQRTARALFPKRRRRDSRQGSPFGEETGRSFWQARFNDFNVWTTKKRVEKLRYMHRNPVNRGLVESPEQWRWSSYRSYLLEEVGPVRVNVGWTEISFRDRVAWLRCCRQRSTRPFAQNAKERGTRCLGGACEGQRPGHPPSVIRPCRSGIPDSRPSQTARGTGHPRGLLC
jgi:putative transposase